MNESQIALLFGLFAGSDVDTGKYQSLLELAVTEVRQALREDADESDARLNYLAAAVTLVHYTELTAPRDRTACTFAGTIAQNTDAAQKLAFAQTFAAGCRTMCRDLLLDDTFQFFTV